MSYGVWAPFKELASVVHTAIAQRQSEAFYSLETILKKHKPDFLSLLKNPARSATHHSQVQKAAKEGLKISSLPQPLTLPQDFIDEALVLSDILELNELFAVELLLAGEQQQPDFPSLTRGLVSVLLYHDGRRNLVTALRNLIQAREGITWTLGLSQAVVSLVTNFTDDLFNNGLIDNIFNLLDSLDVEKELNKLSKGRAIKDAYHRSQLAELIEEQRHALADCIFYWSCQKPLPKDVTLKVLNRLKQVPEVTEYQPLDYVTLSLLFSLLSCFTVGPGVTGEDFDMSLTDDLCSILSDATFLPAVSEEVVKNDWLNSGLHATVLFAWGVALRECSTLDFFKDQSEFEADDDLVHEGITHDALVYLGQAVVASQYFHQEEYYVRQVHSLITNFIVLMPGKVTELRNLGDEVSREISLRMARGIAPLPSTRQDFGELMKLVGDVYCNDPCDLQLSLEYWAPVDSEGQGRGNSRIPYRQLSLLKFIHHCSDLLPAPLFCPFMHMLAGLSNSFPSSHHCFNLLKANSPSLGGGGPSAAISLDHFYDSLHNYYVSLRQTPGARQPPSSSISPQELDGLTAVLKLIQTIANLNENARVVMYENQKWVPVASLFGLLGSAIPRSLKTEILHTLTAFARSPEVAAPMWHTLEMAQLLNTRASNSGGGRIGGLSLASEGSIQIELEEIETQIEEYSETRAFLDLLDNLTDVPVPVSLGAGHRVPGFQPYLEFVRDAVFLKFDSRGYKDPQEKWLVAGSALKVLHKMISSHHVTAEDFVEQSYQLPGGGVVKLPQQPGHALLMHMMNDSILFRKVLYIVDECCCLLADVDTSSEPVARTALLAMKMIEAALSKEEEFLTTLRQSSSHSVTVTPIPELLLGINPRTRKTDHLVNIVRFVSYSSHGPELALVAVSILYSVSSSVRASREMLSAITANHDASVAIVHGFVEHLEWEEPSAGGRGDGEGTSTADLHSELKLNMLKLMVYCIDRPSPNIAHLLLGFKLEKKLLETTLQDPGVLGSPKTCLHAVLSLVQLEPNSATFIGCHLSQPRVAELCYKLLYCLCASRELSQATLRYLRNNHDFFHTQLAALPFPSALTDDDEEGEKEIIGNVALLNQQAWILQAVALELRMTALNNQRSHVQRLTRLLLHSSPLLGHTLPDLTITTNQSINWPTSDTTYNQFDDGRLKLLILLDLVQFIDIPYPPLKLVYFDQARVEQVIASCEEKSADDGVPYVDVKVLHRLLMNEVNTLQGPAVIGQKPNIVKEIHDILGVVVERNSVSEKNHCKQHFLESWRQLVEITLTTLVSGEGEGKVNVLFEIIQDVLLKLEQCDPSVLTTIAGGVLFTLMAHLRRCLAASGSSEREQDNNGDRQENPIAGVHSGPLQSILHGLLDQLMRCSAGMQRLRAFLYASLLCYLNMTRDKSSQENIEPNVWRLEENHNSVVAANLSVLSSFGEGLMETVCRDACSGHDIARMLALSLLDGLVTLDWHGSWLHYAAAKGYLQSVCASLQWDDEGLIKMITPVPESLKTLYIYECKMAFLTRVASTPLGARELVAMNSLSYLNNCHFINRRPSYHDNTYSYTGAPGSLQSDGGGFIPPVTGRYLQLFLPVLQFLSALSSTQGPQLKEARSQVAIFVGSHIDVFASVLTDNLVPVSVSRLQELSLVTGVISLCQIGHDLPVDGSSSPGLLRLHRLSLSLLTHFLSPSCWKTLSREAGRATEEEEEGGRSIGHGQLGVVGERAHLLAQQVCANLVDYCYTTMTTGAVAGTHHYRILFTPDLSEAITPAVGFRRDVFSPPCANARSSSSVSPSLGVLISSLRECCDGYFTTTEALQKLEKKKDSLTNLMTEELRQLIPGSAAGVDKNKLSLVQLQPLARQFLQRQIASTQQQLHQYSYIIEHMLCILWRHMEFYLLYCKPLEQGQGGEMLTPRAAIRRLQDGRGQQPVQPSANKEEQFDVSQLSDGITFADMEQLKKDSVKCITDSLLKRLLDIKDERGQPTVGFIHALVRRVKRLLKLKAAAKPALQL